MSVFFFSTFLLNLVACPPHHHHPRPRLRPPAPLLPATLSPSSKHTARHACSLTHSLSPPREWRHIHTHTHLLLEPRCSSKTASCPLIPCQVSARVDWWWIDFSFFSFSVLLTLFSLSLSFLFSLVSLSLSEFCTSLLQRCCHQEVLVLLLVDRWTFLICWCCWGGRWGEAAPVTNASVTERMDARRSLSSDLDTMTTPLPLLILPCDPVQLSRCKLLLNRSFLWRRQFVSWLWHAKTTLLCLRTAWLGWSNNRDANLRRNSLKASISSKSQPYQVEAGWPWHLWPVEKTFLHLWLCQCNFCRNSLTWAPSTSQKVGLEETQKTNRGGIMEIWTWGWKGQTMLASHYSQILRFCMSSSSRSTCDLSQAVATPKLRRHRCTGKLIAPGQLKGTFYRGAVEDCWISAIRLQSAAAVVVVVVVALTSLTVVCSPHVSNTSPFVKSPNSFDVRMKETSGSLGTSRELQDGPVTSFQRTWGVFGCFMERSSAFPGFRHHLLWFISLFFLTVKSL